MRPRGRAAAQPRTGTPEAPGPRLCGLIAKGCSFQRARKGRGREGRGGGTWAAPALQEKEGPVMAAWATCTSDLGAILDSNICSACPTSLCGQGTRDRMSSTHNHVRRHEIKYIKGYNG